MLWSLCLMTWLLIGKLPQCSNGGVLWEMLSLYFILEETIIPGGWSFRANLKRSYFLLHVAFHGLDVYLTWPWLTYSVGLSSRPSPVLPSPSMKGELIYRKWVSCAFLPCFRRHPSLRSHPCVSPDLGSRSKSCLRWLVNTWVSPANREHQPTLALERLATGGQHSGPGLHAVS